MVRAGVPNNIKFHNNHNNNNNNYYNDSDNDNLILYIARLIAWRQESAAHPRTRVGGIRLLRPLPERPSLPRLPWPTPRAST